MLFEEVFKKKIDKKTPSTQKQSRGCVLLKKVFSKKPENSQGNTCTKVSFSIKLHGSCKPCEVFKAPNLWNISGRPLLSKVIWLRVFLKNPVSFHFRTWRKEVSDNLPYLNWKLSWEKLILDFSHVQLLHWIWKSNRIEVRPITFCICN